MDSFGNPHSADHSFGWQADEAVQKSAASVASIIGADADEIVFTSGATEANNLAILGLAHRAPPTRQRIIVSAFEHKSSLSAARVAAERYGMSFEIVPVTGAGLIDMERLQRMLSDDVLCVVAMAVNNEVGTVQDIDGIAAICADFGVHHVCDAVQAPMATDIDVARTGIATLSLSAHKIHGPKGIGALYVRRGLSGLIEPQIHGGHQQGGLRAGTLPTPLCVGFGAAADILSDATAQAERGRIAGLRDDFEEGLRRSGLDFTINGSDVPRHPGCSNVRFVGRDARDLISMLQPHVAASSGSACSSGIVEPSHVLRAMGLAGEEADASVRFSFGRTTSETDVVAALEAIADALSEEAAA
jgi:cysteine desulfurase